MLLSMSDREKRKNCQCMKKLRSRVLEMRVEISLFIFTFSLWISGGNIKSYGNLHENLHFPISEMFKVIFSVDRRLIYY